MINIANLILRLFFVQIWETENLIGIHWFINPANLCALNKNGWVNSKIIYSKFK